MEDLLHTIESKIAKYDSKGINFREEVEISTGCTTLSGEFIIRLEPNVNARVASVILPSLVLIESPHELDRSNDGAPWIQYGRKSMSFHITHAPYSVLTMYAMSSVDFKGEVVLDLGCDSGLLSKLALLFGAKSVTGVDMDKGVETGFLEYVNSQEAGFVVGKIEENNAELVQRINRAADNLGIVLANIGPHEIYGDAHLDAINMLDNFPTVHTFIGGGYANFENARFNLRPDLALEKLEAKGFNDVQIYELSGYGPGEENQVGFVARR
jgi:SAM-dependent methyltransferase